jgi:hypothetical protein
MSIIPNGDFTKNKKQVSDNQFIYDYGFINSDLNVEYKSDYFPNWTFKKIDNPQTSILIANGNNGFGTMLPPSYGGSNQCLVVQQSYADSYTKPPILKIKNTFSLGPGKCSLSFFAKYRGNTNQSLSVKISNLSSVALAETPVSGVTNDSWTKKTYDFTIETVNVYDLMLTVTNTGLSPDTSIFLTDFEISFLEPLPTSPGQITATPIATSQPCFSLFDELTSLIHPAAVVIKEMEKFTLYGDGDVKTPQPLNNPISDYYNFRPKRN